MKVAVYTGSRSEYGLLLPVLRALRADPDIELLILIGGSHTDPQHGMTGEQVSRDGFDACVAQSLWQSHAGGAPLRAQASEVGVQLIGVAEALADLKPDWLLVYGDRGETLGAAIAAHYQRVSIAHLEAGDTCGACMPDERTRWAITSLASAALATNREAYSALVPMGYPCAFVGLPSLDDIYATESAPVEKHWAYAEYCGAPLALLAQNPELGADAPPVGAQVGLTIRALRECGYSIIATAPNSDPGNDVIRATYERESIRVLEPMAPSDYYALLDALARWRWGGLMIGNSSSAIKEAPAFGLRAVDVGHRQAGRTAVLVTDAYRPGWDAFRIVDAIRMHPMPEVPIPQTRGTDYGYGDGRAGTRVVQALKGKR